MKRVEMIVKSADPLMVFNKTMYKTKEFYTSHSNGKKRHFDSI